MFARLGYEPSSAGSHEGLRCSSFLDLATPRQNRPNEFCVHAPRAGVASAHLRALPLAECSSLWWSHRARHSSKRWTVYRRIYVSLHKLH
ncbi:hypothetical protein J8273_2233 [Carpediemonas membranifera]|uniref:Uncharacterized protein n=1 Tax=Carpediemonas membranifera TaxID=201153 RepID=A0A8J6B565_9EUKA|nr:hypothetical protein J8273_2233 [Carpediemonas membranifera]|eukprot:KAG9395898.1 hypothetical protein J8273_2233 [Carpediemonas membranifera]